MKRPLLVLFAASLLVGLATNGAAGFGSMADYVGTHTIVVKGLPADTLDRGSVICKSSGASVGGGCILFGPGDAIMVMDDMAGTNVAFQVCIDNNGDSLCGGRADPAGVCPDDIFYSHDDAENFFNPLGPLPMSFKPGCVGGFPGYVVFICDGIHVAEGGGTPHQHIAPKGTINQAAGGTGFGNFCGGEEVPAKRYEVK
jgi:hypothetical protein